MIGTLYVKKGRSTWPPCQPSNPLMGKLAAKWISFRWSNSWPRPCRPSSKHPIMTIKVTSNRLVRFILFLLYASRTRFCFWHLKEIIVAGSPILGERNGLHVFRNQRVSSLFVRPSYNGTDCCSKNLFSHKL